MMGVSAGTAHVLGLKQLSVETPPTTAYLMVGRNCIYNCSFCPQAAGSSSSANMLSRVSWPRYPLEDVVKALVAAHDLGKIHRACIQVVHSPDYWEELLRAVSAIRRATPMALSVSTVITNVEQAEMLFHAGVDRISLALDAANKELFEKVKNRSWERTWGLLETLAGKYRGKIATHIIAGLGEKEKDVIHMIQKCKDLNITVGLFAFTPVRGTAMEGRPGPDLSPYRRLQIARHLIIGGHGREGDFTFNGRGEIINFGMDEAALHRLLEDGNAFRTSGCAHCNRPNYNERPGKQPYNFPRPLKQKETTNAATTGTDSLVDPAVI
ncbi:MAG: radical SAM protein [Clostridia bacterium]|nr:radical SAM protein [Clostridia bacterium]